MIVQIEDDSDCTTCTQRHQDHFEMLGKVKVRYLDGLQCQECGRTFDLPIEDEHGGESGTA